MVEILKEMKGWVNMHFAPSLETNTALWEEWQPIKKLVQKKEELDSIGRSSVFYREYMCQIVGDEDQLFKQEYIQYHDYTLKIDKDNNHYLENGEKRKFLENGDTVIMKGYALKENLRIGFGELSNTIVE